MTSRPKALLLQSHVLFGLRVKGGVLNQAVDKEPHVVLHLDGEEVEHTELCDLLTEKPIWDIFSLCHSVLLQQLKQQFQSSSAS